MNDLHIIQLLLAAAAFFTYEWFLSRLMVKVYLEYTVNIKGALLFSLFKAGLLVAGCVFHFPQLLFYCLFFLVGVTDFFFLLKQAASGFLFWMPLQFILFTGFHIICLALISVLYSQSIPETFRAYGIVSLLFTMLLLAASSIIFWKWTPIEKARILLKDTRRLRQLEYFLCYAVAYILFDSLLCMFLLPYRMLPWFIIGSILLLALQILMFVIHTYTISMNSHYETEYYRLEEERAGHVKKEMELKNLAYIDSLTGVFTRRYAMNILDSMLKDGQCLSLAYIDLNGLKKVNDTLGHLEGDRYLMDVSIALNRYLRKNDVLARIGGDEFLIIAPDVTKFQMREWLEAAGRELEERNDIDYAPSFSFGIEEVKTDSGYTAEELLRHADNLMYESKKAFHCRKEESH